jgi:hypothetical protein
MTAQPDSPRAKQLAMLLQAIEDLKQEKARWQAEYKDRMEQLVGEAARLRTDILTGQMSLSDIAEEGDREPATS